MSGRRPSRRGIALLEMIFVILVAGTAAVVAARLFALTMRVSRESTEATNALRGQRQWLGMLRDDAWAATEVTAVEPAATFALAGGSARWAWDGGTLTRTLGEDIRRWPAARPVRWRMDGRSLVVAGDVEVPLATPSLHSGEAR